MDYLDWIMYAAGGTFGLLTLGLGLSRASAFTERDVSPVYWLGFIVAGTVLLVTLIVDWIAPIEAVVYVANGGNAPREVRIDGDILCLPGKSFDNFTWRFSTPKTVVVGADPESAPHYAIGKGTWFINTAQTVVTADMYDRDTSGIDFDAILANPSGAIRVSSRFGRPLRMFSQSSFDRIYSADGDVFQRSANGPCDKPKPPADSAANTPKGSQQD